MKTRLFIRADGSGAWKEADLYSDISIALSLSIAEVRDISKKSASHSSTISLPNTPNNAQLFGCIHEITRYGGSFELLNTYEARIEQDGWPVLTGFFELNKVICDGGVYSYEGVVYNQVKNLAETLGNSLLRGNEDSTKDLDLSEFNIEADDMLLSDFVDNLGDNTHAFGLTLIDKTKKTDLKFYPDEITPYIIAYFVFDKIMQKAGVNYISSFLDGSTTVGSVNMNDVIYPYARHNDNMEAAPRARSVITQRPAFNPTWTFSSYDNSTSKYKNVTIQMSDNKIHWPILTYQLTEENMPTPSTISAYLFKAPRRGKYKFTVKFPFEVRMSAMAWSGTAWASSEYPYYSQNHLKPHATGATDIRVNAYVGNVPLWTRDYEFESDMEPVNVSGKAYYTLAMDYIEITGEKWLDEGASLPITIYAEVNCNYQVTGYYSKLYIDVQSVTPAVEYDAIPFNAEVRLLTDASLEIGCACAWGEGVDFEATSLLSDKMKQWDYVNGLFRMFNLYAEDKGGGLRIEPYSLFYANRPVHDWTSRVDRSSMSFVRIADYVRKTIHFKQTADSDASTKLWNGSHDMEIGEKKVVGPLCIDDTKEEVKSPFGQNIMHQIMGAWLPMQYAENSDGTVNTTADLADRLFIRQRLYDANGNGLIRSRYNSLNWVPVWYYVEASADPLKYKQLYDAFWKPYVDMLNDPNSRMLTCNCYLTARDISELRLSDTIVVDHQQYHINSIKEWTGPNEPCEVELIKVL